MRRSANDLPKGKALFHAFYLNLDFISNVGVGHKNHEALNPGDAVATLAEGFNPNLVAFAPLHGGLPLGNASTLQLRHHQELSRKEVSEDYKKLAPKRSRENALNLPFNFFYGPFELVVSFLQ